MVPENGDFLIMNHINPASPLAILPHDANSVVSVDKFNIEYLSDIGAVDQFYSDLSVTCPNKEECIHRKIFVNKPLRFGGITLYQTDWDMTAVILTIRGSHSFQSHKPISVPVVSLKNRSGFSSKSWGAFIPLEPRMNTNLKTRGLYLVTSDMQSVAIYGSDGKFIGIRRFGSKKPIIIEGIELMFLDTLGCSGIEIKADPAEIVVYLGFAILLLSSFLCSIPFYQIWAVQEGPTLLV